MTTAAPEQTGFELDRFQWTDAERLEVEGRWFGVRGRRFVRPVLTVQVAGRRRRLLAMLEHKPWTADEGQRWLAAFPWEGDHEAVGAAELEVGALMVDLPAPGRAEAGEAAPADPEPAEHHADEASLLAAGETRMQLERDLAGARAELGRVRARHEEEIRDLRGRARQATDRLEELRTRSDRDARRADALAGEATRLREELDRVRRGEGEQLSRMGAAETEARAELERERERTSEAAGEAERLRAAEAGAAAEADRLHAERRDAETELAELREAHEEALAEINKLRQATRRSAAEAERLRAASRRPGGRLPEPPQEPRPVSPLPSKPGPSVRRIPREKPAPSGGVEPAAEQQPAAAEEPAAEPQPTPAPVTEHMQAPRMRAPSGAGASPLLGAETHTPFERRSGLGVWGPRIVAVALVAVLLVALALLVAGIL